MWLIFDHLLSILELDKLLSIGWPLTETCRKKFLLPIIMKCLLFHSQSDYKINTLHTFLWKVMSGCIMLLVSDSIRANNSKAKIWPDPSLFVTTNLYFLSALLNPQEYNESQEKVISTAAHAMRMPFPIPRTCLVQGPPGTGKSYTIVGLVKEILNVSDNKWLV